MTVAVVGVLAACGSTPTPEESGNRSPSGVASPSETRPPTAREALEDCSLPPTDARVAPATVRGPEVILPAVTFDPPDREPPVAVAILLHQTNGDGMCGWTDFAPYLARQDVAALAFDQCGYGRARCRLEDSDDPVPQVRAALDLAERRWPDTRVVLVGASMGGSQAVRAVAAGVPVDAWADLSGPSEWGGVELASVADRITKPGLVAISAATDGAEEAAAARRLAARTGARFLPVKEGHGYDFLTDLDGRLLPVGKQVIAFVRGD